MSAPIVLAMEVHCLGCAHKIKKAVKNMSGVESVFASVETQQVVVDGAADAEALKDRLEAKMRRSVTIVSNGKPPPPARPAPPAGPSIGFPYDHYRYGSYANTYGVPPEYRHLYNDAPRWFNDENPNACSIQ